MRACTFRSLAMSDRSRSGIVRSGRVPVSGRIATITIVDDSPPPPAKRIVSLIPSLTEDLFALGVGGRVVGVSQYSDYPPAARKIAVVSTFASLNAERIVALHPDLVVGIQAQHDLTKQLDEV